MYQSKERRKPGKCPFCEQDIQPDYKDVRTMKSFMTDKGKIVSRSRTGVCQKHQRELSTAIKRARQIALLPYVSVIR